MQHYKTKNVCSSVIEYEVNEENILTHVKFHGGCPGNSQGVSKLCQGRNIDEIITILEGTPCRAGTSCPDQLAKALKEYKANQAK